MKALFVPREIPYNLRNCDKLFQPHSRTYKYGLHSFSITGTALWNKIPDYAKRLNLRDFRGFIASWTPS